jgi:hypothetical protein
MTPECPWCGVAHAADRLCQQAQRDMTRRSFCFLVGAGLAAAVVGIQPSVSYASVDLTTHAPRVVSLSDELLRDCAVNLEDVLFRWRHLNGWAESA